jgi:hypothetical protein
MIKETTYINTKSIVWKLLYNDYRPTSIYFICISIESFYFIGTREMELDPFRTYEVAIVN